MLRHFDQVYRLAGQHGFSVMLWSDMFFRLATGGGLLCAGLPGGPRHPGRPAAGRDPDLLGLLFRGPGPLRPHVPKAPRNDPKPSVRGRGLEMAGLFPGQWVQHACSGSGPRQLPQKRGGPGPGDRLGRQRRRVLALCGAADPAILGRAVLSKRPGPAGASLFQLLPGGGPAKLSLPGRTAVHPRQPKARPGVGQSHKYLFYQDPLCGLFDAHLDPASYPAHFAPARPFWPKPGRKTRPAGSISSTPRSRCAGCWNKNAPWAGSSARPTRRATRPPCRRSSSRRFPRCAAASGSFSPCSTGSGFQENRAFGLDVIDQRVGGLLQRLDTAAERLGAYLGGLHSAWKSWKSPCFPLSPAPWGRTCTSITGTPWSRSPTFRSTSAGAPRAQNSPRRPGAGSPGRGALCLQRPRPVQL